MTAAHKHSVKGLHFPESPLAGAMPTCVKQLDDGRGVVHVQRHLVQPAVLQQEEEDAEARLERAQRLRPPGGDVIGVVLGPEPLLVLVQQEEVLQLLPPEVQLVLVVALHRLRLVHAVVHAQQELLHTNAVSAPRRRLITTESAHLEAPHGGGAWRGQVRVHHPQSEGGEGEASVTETPQV